MVAGRWVLPTSSPARGFLASELQRYLLSHVCLPSSWIGPGSHRGLILPRTAPATALPVMCPRRQVLTYPKVPPHTPLEALLVMMYAGVGQAPPPLLARAGLASAAPAGPEPTALHPGLPHLQPVPLFPLLAPLCLCSVFVQCPGWLELTSTGARAGAPWTHTSPRSLLDAVPVALACIPIPSRRAR